MFCTKCGKESQEGQRFCTGCGAMIMGNKEVINETAPDMIYNPNPAMMAEPVPKKKKHKSGKIVAAIVVLIVVGLAGTVGVMAANGTLGNFYYSHFKSEEEYFKYVLDKNSENALESLDQAYDNAMRKWKQSDAVNQKVTFKVEAGEAVKNLLSYVNPNLANLNSAEFTVHTSVDKTYENLEIATKLNESNLLTVKMAIDNENKTAYLQVPEVSENVYVDISSTMSQYLQGDSENKNALEEVQKIREILPDTKSFHSLVLKYTKLFYKEVKNVEKSGATIEAEGVKQNTTELRTNFDGTYSYNTIRTILHELKEDKEIKSIIEKSDASYEEFIQSIDNFLQQVEANQEEIKNQDVQIVVGIYVNKYGEIAGSNMRCAMNDGMNIFIETVMPKEGSDFGYCMTCQVNNQEFCGVKGNGTLSDGIMNGKFSVDLGEAVINQLSQYGGLFSFDGKDMFDIEIKSIDVDKCKEGMLNGQVVLSTTAIPQIAGYQLKVDFDTEKTSGMMKLGISSERGLFGSLSLKYEQTEKLPEMKPVATDKIYQTYELNSYLLENDVMSQIQNNLDACGIGISIYDLLNMLY